MSSYRLRPMAIRCSSELCLGMSDHEGRDKSEAEKGLADASHTSHDHQQSPESNQQTLHALDTSIQAWLQVLGGFLVMFNTWGVILSYGVFQAYYDSNSTGTNGIHLYASPSSVAWIGSTQAALLLLIGGLCGRLYDAGYLRCLLFTGWFLISLGFFMAPLAKAYWQILLSQSICVGIGMGCLLVPSVATVGTWFSKYRGGAFGIVSSGGAMGGIVLPIMLQRLLDTLGFSWTLRTLGFISFTTLAVVAALLRQRLVPRPQGALFDWTASKEPEFASYTLGYMLVSMGFYVLPQYVQSVS